MQKKSVVVLSLVTVALAGSFYATGLFAEYLLNDAILRLNNNDSFIIKISNYKRGFFSSTASVAYSDSSSDEPMTLSMNIAHGPIVFAKTPQGSKVRLAASRIYFTPTDSMLTEKLIITSIVGFNSKAVTYLDVAQVYDEAPSGLKVSWEPMSGEFRHDLDLSQLSGSLNIPSFVLANSQWNLELNDFSFQRDGTIKGEDFKVKGQASLKQIKFTRQNIDLIKINRCILREIASGNKQTGSIEVDLAVEKARIIDQKFSQEHFTFTASNIRRSVWDKNMQMASFLNPKALAEHAASVTDEIASGAELNLELPKAFSEALLSYLSFEIYRSSPVGQIDPRPPQEVLEDITASIVGLFQDSVNNKLLVERDNKYALNFDLAK